MNSRISALALAAAVLLALPATFSDARADDTRPDTGDRFLDTIDAAHAHPVPSSGARMSTATTLVPLDEVGQHLVTRVRLNEPDFRPTAVLAAADTNGDVVFYAYVAQNRLFTSDGHTDGVPNPAQKFDRYIASSWYRLDVLLHGDTYTLTLDGRDSITARTFVHATEGSVVPDPRPLLGPSYEDAFWSRTRVDVGDGSLETTFSIPLRPDSAWRPHATTGEITIHPNYTGHQAIGHAMLVQPYDDPARPFGRPDGVTYLRADLAGVGATYGLEASFQSSTILVPRGDAWLAGISGDPDSPTVHWALALDMPPLDEITDFFGPGDRALYLNRGDGSRIHLLSWHDAFYHALRVLVDETTGSIQVFYDGQDLGTFTGLPMDSATAIAVGDVDPRAPILSDLWIRVDELAIYPLTAGRI